MLYYETSFALNLYVFVKILCSMTFISISLKSFLRDIPENKPKVFEISDCTTTVHNNLYYNELKI